MSVPLLFACAKIRRPSEDRPPFFHLCLGWEVSMDLRGYFCDCHHLWRLARRNAALGASSLGSTSCMVTSKLVPLDAAAPEPWLRPSRTAFENRVISWLAMSSARDRIGFFFFLSGDAREAMGCGMAPEPMLSLGMAPFEVRTFGPLCLLVPVLDKAWTLSDQSDMPWPVAFNQMRDVDFHCGGQVWGAEVVEEDESRSSV